MRSKGRRAVGSTGWCTKAWEKPEIGDHHIDSKVLGLVGILPSSRFPLTRFFHSFVNSSADDNLKSIKINSKIDSSWEAIGNSSIVTLSPKIKTAFGNAKCIFVQVKDLNLINVQCLAYGMKNHFWNKCI